MQQQTIDRIVRPAEATVLSGYCDVHLRRLEDRGEFPRRFKLSDNSGRFGATGWLLSDIMAWVESRAASRISSPLQPEAQAESEAEAKLRSAEAQEDEAVEADAEKDGNEEEDEEQEAAA
jgi:predicted DNA-binding transcriptional regulator AlpA